MSAKRGVGFIAVAGLVVATLTLALQYIDFQRGNQGQNSTERDEFTQPQDPDLDVDPGKADRPKRYEAGEEAPKSWRESPAVESPFAMPNHRQTNNGCVVIGNWTQVPLRFWIKADNYYGDVSGPFVVMPNHWMPFGFPGAGEYFVVFPDFHGASQPYWLATQQLPPGIMATPDNCTVYNFHYHLDQFGNRTGGLLLLRHR